MSRSPRMGFIAVALVFPIALPALAYLTVALLGGHGVGGAVSALVAQIRDGRPNPGITGILGLLPVLLLLLGMWIGRRFDPEGRRIAAAGWGGLGGILIVLLWANLTVWPLYLPGRPFPGFPHGLELVIGPIFFAPIAAVLGVAIGWFAGKGPRTVVLIVACLALAGVTTALIAGVTVSPGTRGGVDAPAAATEDSPELGRQSALPAVAPAAPVPCRCAQEPLAAYYDRADEVMLARLARAEQPSADGDRLLAMSVAEIPWRTSAIREARPLTGDLVTYVTSASTAECGVPVDIDAVYVVFAQAPADPDAPLRLDTCSGTRIYIPSGGGEPLGFDDVPGSYVVSQLDALSGLDALADFTAAYPDGDDPDNETLIGLLEVPAFEVPGGAVPIRRDANVASPVLTRVGSYDGIESREVGYEQPAAVVLARVDGWSRIRLRDARYGWIGPEDAGVWFPYADLPVNSLAYLTEAWSGHVWPEAGAGIPARSSRRATQERREYAAEVHESAIVGGTIWFRVTLLSGSPCEGGEVGPELSGWVPGYGPGGEPAVWYYSRGC